MRLQQLINILSTRKHITGGFGTQSTIVSRAVVDQKNKVSFDPDFDITTLKIPGAVVLRAPAVIFTDVITQARTAMVFANGAPVFTAVPTALLLMFAFMLAICSPAKAQTTSEVIFSGPSALITGTTNAAGSLTLNGVPAASDSFVISSTASSGTMTYKYVAALSGGTSPNEIVLGTNATSTITRTINAINSSGSSAGAYNTSGTLPGVLSGTGTGNSVSLSAITTGTNGNGITLSGTFTNATANFFSGTTLTGGAVASGTINVLTIPATSTGSGTFAFTGADVGFLSGTISTSPAGYFQAITNTGTYILSSTSTLTGTTAGTATHLSALTIFPQVITGTTSATVIGFKNTTTGTAGAGAAFTGKFWIKGYNER